MSSGGAEGLFLSLSVVLQGCYPSGAAGGTAPALCEQLCLGMGCKGWGRVGWTLPEGRRNALSSHTLVALEGGMGRSIH